MRPVAVWERNAFLSVTGLFNKAEKIFWEEAMKVAIMTDTNSGISVEEGARTGVHVLPMPVLIDEIGRASCRERV